MTLDRTFEEDRRDEKGPSEEVLSEACSASLERELGWLTFRIERRRWTLETWETDDCLRSSP